MKRRLIPSYDTKPVYDYEDEGKTVDEEVGVKNKIFSIEEEVGIIYFL